MYSFYYSKAELEEAKREREEKLERDKKAEEAAKAGCIVCGTFGTLLATVLAFEGCHPGTIDKFGEDYLRFPKEKKASVIQQINKDALKQPHPPHELSPEPEPSR